MSIIQYNDLINQAAKKYGIPANLIANVMKVESGGNPTAASGTGPVGLMQISRALASQYGYGQNDRLDPAKNIDMGAHYLQQNLQHFGGNVQKALLGYNQGTAGADAMLSGKRPMAAEGLNYVRNPTFRANLGDTATNQIANPIAALQASKPNDQFTPALLQRDAAAAAPNQVQSMVGQAIPIAQLTPEQQADQDEQKKRENYGNAALMALSMLAARQPNTTVESSNTGVGRASSNYGLQTQRALAALGQYNR